MPTANMTFDPFTQSLTGLMADGSSPLLINMHDLDYFLFYNAKVCINYGAQLGASIAMFVVVLVTSHEKKRQSPLFFLNLLSLAISALRSLLQVLYYTSQWTEIFINFADDYSTIPRSDYATSIASVVTVALFVYCIELSLLMQTHVVCVTLDKHRRLAVMLLSYAVASLAIVFRTILMVGNAVSIMKAESFDWTWALDGALITETASVWYFCLVFVIKLGITIVKRKKMGLKQFGPMQIICIMGGCTMVIPSIFAILEYVQSFPQASSITITAVAILLPLSSLWASASVEDRLPRFTNETIEARNKLFGSYSSGQPSNYYSNKRGSVPAIHSASIATHVERPRAQLKSTFDDDLLMDNDIHIEKSYSVRSGDDGATSSTSNACFA